MTKPDSHKIPKFCKLNSYISILKWSTNLTDSNPSPIRTHPNLKAELSKMTISVEWQCVAGVRGGEGGSVSSSIALMASGGQLQSTLRTGQH